MQHFCMTEWHNNLHLRKSKQDECVHIRAFVYQAHRWIWDYRPLYTIFGPAVCIYSLCGPLREDLDAVDSLVFNHIIIIGNGAIQNFIQQGERVARYLLNNRLDAVQKIAVMNDLETYFTEPDRDSGLLRTFKRRVSVPWLSVRDSLAQGYVLIPKSVIEPLLHELANLVRDARENYDLPGPAGASAMPTASYTTSWDTIRGFPCCARFRATARRAT